MSNVLETLEIKNHLPLLHFILYKVGQWDFFFLVVEYIFDYITYYF